MVHTDHVVCTVHLLILRKFSPQYQRQKQRADIANGGIVDENGRLMLATAVDYITEPSVVDLSLEEAEQRTTESLPEPVPDTADTHADQKEEGTSMDREASSR
eukprot:scaffold75_cov165-Amphora_coffeaeformis.AAC.4